MKIKQITVFLENRPGELSAITTLLRTNGINLRAIHVADATEYGITRMVVKETEKTYEILKENGFICNTVDVVAAFVPDKPGGLGSVTDRLLREKINVEYMYSMFVNPEGRACMIFKVEDVDRLEMILESMGYAR